MPALGKVLASWISLLLLATGTLLLVPSANAAPTASAASAKKVVKFPDTLVKNQKQARRKLKGTARHFQNFIGKRAKNLRKKTHKSCRPSAGIRVLGFHKKGFGVGSELEGCSGAQVIWKANKKNKWKPIMGSQDLFSCTRLANAGVPRPMLKRPGGPVKCTLNSGKVVNYKPKKQRTKGKRGKAAGKAKGAKHKFVQFPIDTLVQNRKQAKRKLKGAPAHLQKAIGKRGKRLARNANAPGCVGGNNPGVLMYSFHPKGNGWAYGMEQSCGHGFDLVIWRANKKNKWKRVITPQPGADFFQCSDLQQHKVPRKLLRLGSQPVLCLAGGGHQEY